jgi:hypothetical protein
MLHKVLTSLYFSNDRSKQNLAFKVIEGACDPLMHNADLEIAKEFEIKLNKYLLLGGYQLKYFKLEAIKRYNAYEDPKLRMFQNGPLVLNLSKGTISFGNVIAQISPGTNEVVFLSLLMGAVGKIVTYKIIARETDLNVYNTDIANNDVELKKAVNYLRRDLNNYLTKQVKDAKCVSAIANSIINVTNMGYKMNPIQQIITKRS